MGSVPSPRALAEVLRRGNLHARLRAARQGLTGVRLQLIAAALDLGVLDALREGPASAEQLAGRLGESELLTVGGEGLPQIDAAEELAAAISELASG